MLRVTLLLFFCGLAYTANVNPYKIEEAESYFEDFIQTYNKQYKNEQERQERLELFKKNLENINRLNHLNPHAVHGINKFADYTSEEMKSLLGLKLSDDYPPGYCQVLTGEDVSTGNAPAEFDWRSKNAVTSVKTQAQCGACYAFSTIGNIEGQYAIKHNKLVDFSPQQLVDCSKNNWACNGGFMTVAMSDIMDCKGLATLKQYPYTGSFSNCYFNESLATVKLSSCINYNLKDENKLKEILFKTGPIAVAIDARDVHTYTHGVLSHCRDIKINHAILLVGYGTENGVDYWLLKNSWGSSWGYNGYFKISRGKNTCGIMNGAMASAVIE